MTTFPIRAPLSYYVRAAVRELYGSPRRSTVEVAELFAVSTVDVNHATNSDRECLEGCRRLEHPRRNGWCPELLEERRPWYNMG